MKDFLWDDFEKTPELMAAGEAAARAAVPNIRLAIEAPESGAVHPDRNGIRAACRGQATEAGK